MTYRNNYKTMDFYKGQKTDPVIANFIKGIYFNSVKHENELLGNKLTKYNQEFINKLNELNHKFFIVISAYSVIIKILDAHSYEVRGVVNNLYRLIRAQGGTIRFNRLLKSSLRKYEVRQKKIHEAIKSDIIKQEDRLDRNSKLLIETMEETGLNWILKVLDLEEHKNLFESIGEFINKKKEEASIIDNEDEFYDRVRDEYLQYLESLDIKYEIDSFGVVSETLLRHLQARKEMSNSIAKRFKEQKEADKLKELTTYILNDNSAIQRDIVSLAEIIEGEIPSQHVSSNQAHKLSRWIWRCKVAKFWYIAFCRRKRVYYVASSNFDDKMYATTSITVADKFLSKKHALSVIDNVSKTLELDNCAVEIMCIDTFYKEVDVSLDIKGDIKNPDKELQGILYESSCSMAKDQDEYSRIKRYIMQSALKIENNRFVADGMVAAFSYTQNNEYKVLTKQGDRYLLGDIDSSYIVLERYKNGVKVSRRKVGKQVLEFKQIAIGVGTWKLEEYANVLNEHCTSLVSSMQCRLYNKNYVFEDISIGYGEVKDLDIMSICDKKLAAYKSENGHIGYSQVYFVTVFDTQDLKEKFLGACDTMITKSIHKMSFFNSINSANEAIKNAKSKDDKLLCIVHKVRV